MDNIIEQINKISKEQKEKQVETVNKLSIIIAQLYNEQRMDKVLSKEKTTIR